MANINLLPWRAERRKQREREFYMMLAGTAIAALAVLFAAIFWMSHLIGDQNDRNAYLQREIKAHKSVTACVRNGRVEVWGWVQTQEEMAPFAALEKKHRDTVKSFVEVIARDE